MRILLLAAISASAAGLAGVKLAGTQRQEVPKKLRSEDRSAARTKRWRAGDLNAWASDRNSQDPFKGEWEGWSDEELREALEDGVGDPGIVLELGDVRRIVEAIFGEMVRRSPDEAIRWLGSLGSESMRRLFSGALAMNWPTDRAAEGLAYVIAHRSDFMSSNSVAYGPIVRMSINDAAKLGPEAVGRLFGVFRENGIDPRYSRDWEFPAGFDFAELAEHPETRSLKASFFAGIWMSRDPEDAFRKLIADRDKWEVPARDLFRDLIRPDDPRKMEAGATRARWLSGKLGEFPKEKRWTVALGISKSLGSPVVAGSFVAGIEDQELRNQIVSDTLEDLMRPNRGGGVAKVLQFVEAAGEGEWRIETLGSLKPPGIQHGWFVTADDEKLIRMKAAEWNASPDQVEHIVDQLKGE